MVVGTFLYTTIINGIMHIGDVDLSNIFLLAPKLYYICLLTPNVPVIDTYNTIDDIVQLTTQDHFKQKKRK